MEFPFPRKEFATAGDDSGHYKPYKRTYSDTYRPGDDDDCGERGRVGSERRHRPPQRCDDFATAGRVRVGNEFPREKVAMAGDDSGHYKPHKRTYGDTCKPGDDDDCGERGRVGSERRHRPPQRCDDFATAGRVRVGNEFPREKVAMAGDDSGHYKPHKRTYGDTCKPGDDDDCGERGRVGSERRHRPPQRCDDFATAGRVRVGNEFPREKVATAGDDGGHYKPHKRTYSDKRRPGDDDDDCGERSRDGSERHHRPSLPHDDFATAGRVRDGNEFPFPRKEFATAGDSGHYKPHKRTYGDTFRPGEDDDCGERGRDGPERHQRPSLPRDEFATAGRIRGSKEFPFATKEFVAAGADSGHYKPYRTHGDSFGPDGDYVGERDSKRDRRDRAKDEVGSLPRCKSGDRRISVVVAVALNEVRGAANAPRDCRDNALCASRDLTETCVRTERGAIREISDGKCTSSNVSKSATVHSRIQATQASQMKVTDSVPMGEVSDRSKVTASPDADPHVSRKRILPDKCRSDESISASKEADERAEVAASLQTCSGDGRPLSTGNPRLSHDGKNRHPCGALESSGIVCRGYRCGGPRSQQNGDAAFRPPVANVSKTLTESGPNAEAARKLDEAADIAGYKEAAVAVENMLKLMRRLAPKLTDKHATLESAYSRVQDAQTRDLEPPTCSNSIGTDGPAQPSSHADGSDISDEAQAHVISEATPSSSSVHGDVFAEVVVNPDLGSTTEVGDTGRTPDDLERARPVHGVASTSPTGRVENGEEGIFDKGPDTAAGPSSLSNRDVVPADPLAAFVGPAKDVTAAVHQWLDSSDVDCELETESFTSTVPDDFNEVILLSESFPTRETTSLAGCGVATVLSGSSNAPTTSRPSVEDLQLYLPLSSWAPNGADTESGFTSSASLTEDVLFRLNACTALYVASLCRDEEAKRRVLRLYARGRRTGTTEDLAADVRKIACAAVERKRVLWKDLTCVLRRLARVRWVVPEAGIGAGVKIREIRVPGSRRNV
ncbi:hypothetical protein MTO96_025220 [Rhipicephalus appendiculatus]